MTVFCIAKQISGWEASLPEKKTIKKEKAEWHR
jgi:hypothetical protein